MKNRLSPEKTVAIPLRMHPRPGARGGCGTRQSKWENLTSPADLLNKKGRTVRGRATTDVCVRRAYRRIESVYIQNVATN